MTSFLPVPTRAAMCALLAVACGLARAEAAAPAKQSFDVFEFQVEGNTVLGTEDIERAVYPFMGEQRSIDDVEGARTALEKAYHDGGYGTVSVDIPPQKVVAGVVRLNVVQGRIARLRVVGARYFSQDRILENVPELAEGKVPDLAVVQQQLAQVNTSPDARVTPLLRPGKEPGTTEVDLQVEDELPLHGSLELNNAHAAQTSSLRATAGLRYANLFQRGHVIGLQYETAPRDVSQVKVLIGTYSMPLEGGTLLLSAVKSDSSTFVGNGVGVFANGKVLGARFVEPVASDDPAKSQRSLTFGVDWKDSGQSLALADGTGVQTPLRYLPFSLTYAGTQFDDRGASDWSAGVVFAVRDLGSDQQQFQDKRFRAHSDFALAKWSLARTQKLPADTSLHVVVEGQATGDPLVSNEQFVAGGEDSVRGYLESTETGDIAVRTSVEFRTPDLRAGKSRVDFLQFRTFFDAAWLRQLSPLPGTRSSWNLSSYGLGLTMKAQPGFTLRGDLAWPLVTLGTQPALQPRVQASALYQF